MFQRFGPVAHDHILPNASSTQTVVSTPIPDSVLRRIYYAAPETIDPWNEVEGFDVGIVSSLW